MKEAISRMKDAYKAMCENSSEESRTSMRKSGNT